VQQRNLTILKSAMLGTAEDEMAGAMSFASLTDAVAVAMEQWSAQHHAFIAEIFF
jgi:hypothetical protein